MKEVEIFRFDVSADVEPYFDRYYLDLSAESSADSSVDSTPDSTANKIILNKESTLTDLLKSLIAHSPKNKKPLSVDTEHIALRINDCVIFSDLKLIEIFTHFGEFLRIAPIAPRFIMRDLLINKDAVLSRYAAFFESASFLTKSEVAEFEKFLMINFISPIFANADLGESGESYFGDGFFLYVKWLIARYPNKRGEFLKMLSVKDGGIMNFVPIGMKVFPNARALDDEIRELQQMLTIASKCPFSASSNAWARLCDGL